jgi:3-methyladenine DNA glycosylase Tag
MVKIIHSAYQPAQDISDEESFILWKSHLSLKQYILLKVAKFGIKTFKLCESFNRYLWNLTVYTGASTDITTSIDVPDNQQSSKIVARTCTALCQHKIHFVETIIRIHHLCVDYLETIGSVLQVHSI